MPVAHSVEVDSTSKLGAIIAQSANASEHVLSIPVNSSHHQAAEVAGDGLRVVARCPEDGIIEALEGTTDDHFVMACNGTERLEEDETLASTRALVEAARHERQAVREPAGRKA